MSIEQTEPAAHLYAAKELRLSAQATDNRLYPFIVTGASNPPDAKFLGELQDEVSTNDVSMYTGGENPSVEYDLKNIKAVIACSRALARSALTLTQNHYPELRISLDSTLSVYARDILDDPITPDPPRLF